MNGTWLRKNIAVAWKITTRSYTITQAIQIFANTPDM